MSKYKPELGKNVIETLTMGMYDDPRFIFREYVQNSADAIDLAVRSKVFKNRSEGKVEITIDQNKRKIIVADNAIGIESKTVQRLLVNVADSTKDKHIYKGFRGIGRLGGLGYCDKLVFETSFGGERVKSKMVFDAKRLKKIIDDAKSRVSAAELVSVITEFSKDLAAADDHYFRVTLETVADDILLDVPKIKEYLCMVAPVSYSDNFKFKSEIHSLAQQAEVQIDSYNVTLDGTPLYKAYKNDILKNGRVVDSIYAIQTFEERIEKQLLYWGWFGITSKMQQIPEENIERSFRLRKSNIQIGLDNRLDSFHKKPDGNKYFVGEIFAVHKELVPNARRDFFIDNLIENTFRHEVKEFFQDELYKLVYDFSTKNSAVRAIQFVQTLERKVQNAKETGNKDEEKKFLEKIEEQTAKVYKASSDLIKLHKEYKETPLGEIIEKNQKISDIRKIQQDTGSKIENADDESNETDAFGQLSYEEKKLLSFIFKVIKRNFTKQQSTAVIKKIKKELADYK